MRTHLSQQRQWLRDCRGSLAIPLAFAILVLAMMTGLALDGARAYSAHQKIAAILDAAALAGAKALQEGKLSDEQVRELTEVWIADHLTGPGTSQLQVSSLSVQIDRVSNSVEVQLYSKNGNTIANIAGYPHFDLANKSAATFGASKVELGLMLDVSGSMEDYGKIDELKAAVTSLINIMMPPDGSAMHTRIGLAPYSTSVNAGAYVGKVRGGSGKCVSERRGSKAFTDDTPKSNPMGARSSFCPANEVQALTDNRSSLLEKVDQLTPNGSTAGHLGAAWAWYLVSPNWADIWPEESKPAAYGEKNNFKAVVLMTDGMFNTEYESANGRSDEQAAQLCTNMKAAGVVVFTIGFQAPASVLPTLENCATSPRHFFDASDGAALTGAFNTIAEKLSQLRLSK